MGPGLRKLLLTTHIVSTLGWLGAVVGFLALTVTGLVSEDREMERAVYLVAEPLTLFVLVPLSLASLLTGIIQSLGTPWGLFRHYWVVFKLVITVFATTILLLYTQTVSYFANGAAGVDTGHLGGLGSYLLHSAGGLVVLLVATVLAVYKPQGLTPYGMRKQRELRERALRSR